MNQNQITPFSAIYDSFFAHISDDMYMELTEFDTYLILQDLLENAIPRFEFPRFDIFDYEIGVLVEDEYEGIGHCALGYAFATANDPAPRKENYVY